MTVLVFTLVLFAGAFSAGLVGSLTGLGGGVIIIPLLSVFMGVDIHYAIGAALVSVIATSSGSAAAYVREGITNMRIGMFLEIATTVGAVLGALLATVASPRIIAILFGGILIFSAINSLRKKSQHILQESSPLAMRLRLYGSYPDAGKPIHYGVRHVAGGFVMMIFAGIMSGLLGIGSGALKVIAMDNIMRIPFKVSTTTSNFMMGVTATASAVVYLQRGYIQPTICMPVVVGVLFGALTGARILLRTPPEKLRKFFAAVIGFLALQMIYNGITGKI